MAGYLAQTYPGDYYSQDWAKSGDFIGYFDNQRQKQESLQNQQINRRMALEDMFRQQEKFPLEQALQQGRRDQQVAQLPGFQAQSDRLKREEAFDASIPEDTKRQTVLNELAAKYSKAELENEENQINKWLLRTDLDPKTRAGLEFARSQMKDIYKLQQTLGTRQGIEQYKVDNRPPPRATSGGTPKPPADPKSLAASLAKFATLAAVEKDPDLKAMYERQANEIQAKILAIEEAKARAKAEANQINKPDMDAMGVPTYKPPEVRVPGTAPKPATPAQSGTVRMKDKAGKIYNVPAGRKQEALSDGLTIAE